jgi:4'-phosphopantetheinyl transferase
MVRALPNEEVHIWCAQKPSILSTELVAILSPEECDRAARFKFPKHRMAYQFAHAVLRDVLCRYLSCSPRDVRFNENTFGKPFLQGGVGGIETEFNLSHSGNLVFIGVSRGQRIGVDVEEIRDIEDILTVTDTYFTPQECAFINRGGLDRRQAFFRCWTRKEAYVKAVGKGLSIPLNCFDTQLSSGFPYELLEIPDGSWRRCDQRAVGGTVNVLANLLRGNFAAKFDSSA